MDLFDIPTSLFGVAYWSNNAGIQLADEETVVARSHDPRNNEWNDNFDAELCEHYFELLAQFA
jgi:hypothetical protein